MSGDLTRPNKHTTVRTYARATHPAILAMDGFSAARDGGELTGRPLRPRAGRSHKGARHPRPSKADRAA
jgi:hypothetical protein